MVCAPTICVEQDSDGVCVVERTMSIRIEIYELNSGKHKWQIYVEYEDDVPDNVIHKGVGDVIGVLPL